MSDRGFCYPPSVCPLSVSPRTIRHDQTHPPGSPTSDPVLSVYFPSLGRTFQWSFSCKTEDLGQLFYLRFKFVSEVGVSSPYPYNKSKNENCSNKNVNSRTGVKPFSILIFEMKGEGPKVKCCLPDVIICFHYTVKVLFGSAPGSILMSSHLRSPV